jgi:hypothetical protein
VTSTVLLATNTVAAVFWLLVGVTVIVLTFVTWAKIISKAGRSSWWILLPISAVVLWIMSQMLGVDSLTGLIRSPFGFNAAEYDAANVLHKIALALVIASWILFVLFGFSDWPALHGFRPRAHPSAGDEGAPLPPSPDPTSPSPDPTSPPPPRAQNPGWYQVGATNNDQGFWDGQDWTARRRWEGAGWTDVPFARSDPGP